MEIIHWDRRQRAGFRALARWLFDIRTSVTDHFHADVPCKRLESHALCQCIAGQCYLRKKGKCCRSQIALVVHMVDCTGV